MQEAQKQTTETINNDPDLPPFNPQLGHNMLQYYTLDPEYINTNNGSFGSCPRYVIKAKERYTDQMEARPDFFFNYTHPQIFETSRKLIAKFLDASPEDLVFVKSATEAVNVILKSLDYERGDIILLFDITYNAVKTLCRKLVDDYQVNLVVIETTQEILNSKELIIKAVKDKVQEHGKKIKIALLDHLASFPCIIVPIQDLIPIFRENGVLCMIDGAHAASQVDISLKKLDPDFYYTNLHKWTPIPQSIAVLYVKKEYQKTTHPVALSRAYKKGFTEEFVRLGTRDFSNIYCVKEALEFWERVGLEKMREYCKNLAREVGKRVAEIWKTEVLVSTEEMVPFMVNVIFPYQEKDTPEKFEWSEPFKKAKTILQLAQYHETYVLRFSCTLYNELSDYEKVAKSILEMMEAKN